MSVFMDSDNKFEYTCDSSGSESETITENNSALGSHHKPFQHDSVKT
jgi:hypothetical protein